MVGFRLLRGYFRLVFLFVKLVVAYLNPFSNYWLNSMVFDLWNVAKLEVKVDKLTEKLAKDEEKLDDILSEMVIIIN